MILENEHGIKLDQGSIPILSSPSNASPVAFRGWNDYFVSERELKIFEKWNDFNMSKQSISQI